MKERHKAIPASYLFLYRDGKLLLTKRQNTGYYDGWYVVPSGHVEEGGLPATALSREAKEEVGVTLDPSSIKLVHTMYRTKHDVTGDRADYFFEASILEGEPTNMEPEKCNEVAWFPLDQLPENIMHHVREALNDARAGISYSEIGRDKTHTNPNTPSS